MAHGLQHVAEQKASALYGSEKITHHRKSAALDAAEENGRSAGLTDPALNFRGFEIGIDFFLKAHKLTGAFKVAQTGGESGIAHICSSKKFFSARSVHLGALSTL